VGTASHLRAMPERDRTYDWSALASLVHPIRVEIIEAILCIEQPLSATQLAMVFDRKYELPRLSYHVGILAKAGLLKVVSRRQVRGAVETFYTLR
jgi:DNA-binding transcriptional ArsR family regulator